MGLETTLVSTKKTKPHIVKIVAFSVERTSSEFKKKKSRNQEKNSNQVSFGNTLVKREFSKVTCFKISGYWLDGEGQSRRKRSPSMKKKTKNNQVASKVIPCSVSSLIKQMLILFLNCQYTGK